MHLLECDVVVVGAGPAGSLAARSAAELDSNVILIEEHGKVGYPIYCAEGLSLAGIEDAGIKPEPPIVSQEITKARVFAPNHNYIELMSTDWKGFTLNRDEFDQALAEKAIESGAELLTSTKAMTVLRDGARIVGIQAEAGGEPIKILSKVVIGADGHASIIRRTAGLGKYFPDFVTCAQYRLRGIELEEPWVIEFYLGSEISPGGYAWVFPKSISVANVGLGVRRIHKEAPINYLNKFIASDSRFKDAEILLVNGGICPVSGCIEKVVGDGIMLIGDAAGQLIPMTGAGIHSSIESGKIAGAVAAMAVKESDISAKRLSEYEKRFDEHWGKRIRASRRVVEMLDKFSDENLNTLASVITHEDIINLVNGNAVPTTLAKIIARSPRGIIGLLSAYLRS